jgi:hypothetical protein
MAAPSSPNELFLGGLVLASVVAALLPFAAPELPVAWRGFGSLQQLSRLGLLAAAIFMQWKHAFVKHSIIAFYCFTLLVPFLLLALFPVYNWRAVTRVRLTTACFLLSFTGFTLTSGLDWPTYLASLPDTLVAKGKSVLDPSPIRKGMEQDKAQKERDSALPLVRARVQEASVDILSFEQGVLLLNHLNWKPRPVFQSYSAYTPWLLEANAEFFRSAEAPQYVLFKLQTIDGRFPTLDDGPALLAILQKYRPVLVEKSYLLLERCQNLHDAPSGQVVLNKQIRFGEELDLRGLPGKFHTLAVKITPSLKGRLRKFVYQPPAMTIQLRVSGTRDILTFRLIPAMAENGFILNPLLQAGEHIVNLYDYEKPQGNTVTAFRIVCTDPGSYTDTMAVTIKSFPRLVGPQFDPRVLNHVRYPVMKTPFTAAKAKEPITVVTCDGKAVLRAHAPSEIEFDLPARLQEHLLTGYFGLLPGTWEDEQNHTDGVQFAVEYTPAGGSPQVLFQRYLDPHAHPKDRGMQKFATWLPAGPKGKVVLRAYNLPDKNDHLDQAYWTEVEIEGLQTEPQDQHQADDDGAKYKELIQQVHKAVRIAVPAGCTVLVVSKWDNDLTRLPGRNGWHFPQTKDGTYAEPPADSAEAIACLEALRTKGGQFLLIPEPYSWWLEHYQQFKEHLDNRYRCVHRDQSCIIYQLSNGKQDKKGKPR